jgi:hypothetical protein
MKRVLDPFNAQIRANLLKTGLMETLRRRVQARAVQLSTGYPIASPAVAAGIPGGAAVEDAMVDNGWHPTLLECLCLKSCWARGGKSIKYASMLS